MMQSDYSRLMWPARGEGLSMDGAAPIQSCVRGNQGAKNYEKRQNPLMISRSTSALMALLLVLQSASVTCWVPPPLRSPSSLYRSSSSSATRRKTSRRADRRLLALPPASVVVVASNSTANSQAWSKHKKSSNASTGGSSSSSSAATTTTTSHGSMGDIMGKERGVDTGSSFSLLRESSGPSLAHAYGIHHPLDRMLVTANGNLQRLLASYYDAEVTVIVLQCSPRRRPGSATTAASSSAAALLPTIWDRTVELRLLQQHPRPQEQRRQQQPSSSSSSSLSSVLLCTAVSEITIRSEAAADAIASGRVGIGQWFRHNNLLPTFELHAAGYHRHDDDHHRVNNASKNDDDQDQKSASSSSSSAAAAALWRIYTLDSDDMQCRIREDFVPGVWDL